MILRPTLLRDPKNATKFVLAPSIKQARIQLNLERDDYKSYVVRITTVEGNPVFVYHDTFNPDLAEVEDLKARYRAGKVGDVEVKMKLAGAINTRLAPIRERREAALARPDYLRDVLIAGSERARSVARETMARVRDAVKLRY